MWCEHDVFTHFNQSQFNYCYCFRVMNINILLIGLVECKHIIFVHSYCWLQSYHLSIWCLSRPFYSSYDHYHYHYHSITMNSLLLYYKRFSHYLHVATDKGILICFVLFPWEFVFMATKKWQGIWAAFCPYTSWPYIVLSHWPLVPYFLSSGHVRRKQNRRNC